MMIARLSNQHMRVHRIDQWQIEKYPEMHLVPADLVKSLNIAVVRFSDLQPTSRMLIFDRGKNGRPAENAFDLVRWGR